MRSSFSKPRLARALFVSLLASLTQITPAVADDDESASDYEVRIFQVGSLTAGRHDFTGERRPPIAPDDVSDESNPMFGRIGEEPEYPLGGASELVALVRALTGPQEWSDRKDGRYITWLGDHAILARHCPKVLDDVARVLAELERRALATVTLQVRARRAGSEPSKGEASGPSLELTGFVGQRISGYSGRQSSYVVDYDVEVAEESSGSDPIVSVSNLGLRADVRVLRGRGEGRLDIHAHAWLADLAGRRTVATGERRTIEAPAFAVTVARGVVQAQSGAWEPLPGGSDDGWRFFIRATLNEWEASPATPARLRMAPGSSEPKSQELFDVRDMSRVVKARGGRMVNLSPSHFTPPEAPERENLASLGTETLISVLRHASLQAWERDGLQQVGSGMLLVRHAPKVLASVGETIAAVRRQFLLSITTRVDVVELPAALLDRVRGPNGAAHLIRGGAEALEQALKDGTARRIHRIGTVSNPGVANMSRAGQHMTYLQDYAIEIAKGTVIGNPVMEGFLSGVQLEVTAHPTGDGNGVALDARFVRSQGKQPLRTLDTPWGPIELPELDLFRVHTSLVVRSGQTMLLGVQGDGPTRRVLLLTSTIQRQR